MKTKSQDAIPDGRGNATGYAYAYDDIGNRLTATEPSTTSTYAANDLNQYTSISSLGSLESLPSLFAPAYDLDGNQTLVETSTGIWQVDYNGENRPVTWTRTNDNTVVTMDFDRMGRRTFYREMSGNTQVSFTRFFYDGYLMIQQLFSNSPYNVYKEFIWDPTEPVATKPLCFRQNGETAAFYTHDGNKNVADVITVGPYNAQVAHYEYAPFGAVTSATGTRVSANPYRFSSEFHDDTLGLVYYNYRHYNPKDGRWTSRDVIREDISKNIYVISYNTCSFDFLGCYSQRNTDQQAPSAVIERYISLLKRNQNALESSGCKFIISYDSHQPFFTLRYDVESVVSHLQKKLGMSFPLNEILTVPNDSMDVLLSTFENTGCICGWIYVGHATEDEGPDDPARLILNTYESLVARDPRRSIASRREDIRRLSDYSFFEMGASLLLGCNTGIMSKGNKSIAEALSDAINTPVIGMAESVNFEKGLVNGASGDSAATLTFGWSRK